MVDPRSGKVAGSDNAAYRQGDKHLADRAVFALYLGAAEPAARPRLDASTLIHPPE